MFFSYLLYISVTSISIFFAGLAQKYHRINNKGRQKPHPIFWFLSALLLALLMGLRAHKVGVDDFNYLRIYNNINSLSFADYYKYFTTEPGYYLLNRIVYLLFNDFQWLIIITSFFIVFSFFSAMSEETKNISLPFAVFVFSTTQYLYYFGIIRLGIAAAIVALGYKFIFEGKRKKFILFVLIATTFHFSALFSFILLLVDSSERKRIEKKTIIRMMILIPLGFLIIRYTIYPLISISKYSKYIESENFISIGFVSSLPLLILFLLFFNKFNDKFNKNFDFFVVFFVIKVITEMFSPIIGIGRMVWYVNLSICFLIPFIVRGNKNKISKLGLFLFLVLYCLFYCYYAYFMFTDSSRGQYMLPYIFFFEN